MSRIAMAGRAASAGRSAQAGRVARIEYQNKIANPEDFTLFSATNCSITPDNIANPIDGTVNADRVVDSTDAVATSHFLQVPATFGTGVKDGIISCLSCFALTTGVIMASSGAQPHTCQLQLIFSSTAGEVVFDLTNGTAGNLSGLVPYDYGIEPCTGQFGAGWFRCWVAFIPTQGGARFGFGGQGLGSQNSHQGSGENLMWLYGAQINFGRTPSPYIPGRTTALDIGTPRTRSNLLAKGSQ